MAKLKWKDVSSFNRIATNRTPKSFTIRVGELDVVVTRHLHYAPHEWVASAHPFLPQQVVGRGTAEDAQKKAIQLVGAALHQALTDIYNIE